jgi:hypothetical protein
VRTVPVVNLSTIVGIDIEGGASITVGSFSIQAL